MATETARPSLISYYTDALSLLGRSYGVAIIPFALMAISMIMQLVTPNPTNPLDWGFWSFSFGLGAIYTLLYAGWFFMLYEAVRQWVQAQHAGPSPTVEKHSPWGLLELYIPGIGQYGLPFLVGSLVIGVIQIGLLAVGIGVGSSTIGIPPLISKMFTFFQENPSPTKEQIDQWAQTIPPEAMGQLGEQALGWVGIFLLLGLVVLVMSVFFMFWMNFIVTRNTHAFGALAASVRHVCEHPGSSWLIALYGIVFMVGLAFIGMIPLIGWAIYALGFTHYQLFIFRYLLSFQDDPLHSH